MREELKLLELHSIEVLELEKIVALAARKAQSVPGAEALRRLELSSDVREVEKELDWTSELRGVYASSFEVPSLGFPDIRGQLETVRVEGSLLEPKDLLEVGRFLSVAGAAVKFFRASRQKCPLSHDLVGDISIDDELKKSIERSIDPNGDVLDGASPALKALRREIEKNREKARALLTSFLESLGSPPDSFPTLRTDRYMVLIPSQSRKRHKGIVHDQSASGAGLYFEPLQAVDVNNVLSRLRAEEKEEILRILRELSSRVRECAPELERALASLTKLDAVSARARFAEELSAVRPGIPGNINLRMREAKHPLLLLQSKEKGFEVCPLNLEMGGGFRILLVSGPNMGGKTVALKTVGLLSLMMKAGFHVPAQEGTEIPVFDRVFCDIGDEQSIEEQLSTFAAHMTQIAAALDGADSSSLVLIDELGAGTDPLEGAALAKSVLEELGVTGALSIASTHLGSLKSFVASNPNMRNASMAFDPETQQPLYRLEVGVPGQSRAIETAARMGIKSSVIDRARSSLTREEVEVSTLLSELEVLRREASRDRDYLAGESRRVAGLVEEYEAKLSHLEADKKALRAKAAGEARELLNEARVLLKGVKETLKSRDVDQVELGGLRRTVDSLDGRMAAEQTPPRPAPAVKPFKIEPGIKVWAYDVGSVVTVVSAPDSDGRVKVERKGVRIDTHVSRLGQAPEAAEPAQKAVASTPPSEDGFSASLDLRGCMADEALESLDKYLDGAMLRGISQVTIIHGKGKGILREKVQEALSAYSFVKTFRLGDIREGGTGVTVVELAT